ncbi:hypothetical protein EOM39_01090 [Candidatus Gracilibacteria bacterium]|nr:hypothetical protein [Candidatus Gracilibacteria bacterium]
MLKKIFSLTVFILGTLFYSISYTYFCDGKIDGENCETGSIIEDIDQIDSFSSDYSDTIIGYQGNNFLSIFNDELETSLGYFGNKYDYNEGIELWSTLGFLGNQRKVLSPDYQTPVGLFGLYKGQTLTFNNIQEENNFFGYPLVKFEQDDSVIINGGSNNNIYCSSPIHAKNTKIEIKSNGLHDYIRLSWDNPGKEKIKIIRISPEYKEYYIEEKFNYFDDYDILSGKKYSYFVIVYNNCNNSGLYSDLIDIDYIGRDMSAKLYLSRIKNDLVLNIPSTMIYDSKTKIRIECKDYLDTFIDSYLINYKYTFDINAFKNYFTCEASFFDNNGILQKSEIYINNQIKDYYIKEKQALDLIYKGDSTNQIYNLLYLNAPKFDSGAYLTYGKSSLYLINILAKTYISDEKLSFDALKSNGYLPPNVSLGDRIPQEDLIKILLFIEKDLSKFHIEIYDFVNANFGNKNYNLVVNEINTNIYYIDKLNEYLKSNENKFEGLLNCISKEGCMDFAIIKTNTDIELEENDINTYKDYMKILYFKYGEKSYKKYNYTNEDYNNFIDILVESISNGDEFYDTKISYNSFRNLQYEILLHKNLQKNISYLTEKHLQKILQIYGTSKKEEMIWILRDFLSK